MKNTIIIVLILFGIDSIQFVAAQSRNDRNREKRDQKYETQQPLMETYELPCAMYDDDEWYVSTGARRIKVGGVGEKSITVYITDEINKHRQQMNSKLKGSYKAIIQDYFDQFDIDSKSSTASHIESAGTLIIDQMTNDMRTDCLEQSEIDDAGFQWYYMGMMAKKEKFLDEIVDGLQKSNLLTTDEKAKIRQNESALRESASRVFGWDKNNDSKDTK